MFSARQLFTPTNLSFTINAPPLSTRTKSDTHHMNTTTNTAHLVQLLKFIQRIAIYKLRFQSFFFLTSFTHDCRKICASAITHSPTLLANFLFHILYSQRSQYTTLPRLLFRFPDRVRALL